MPLTVHSTCRAPASSAESVLATARPRSLWQWTLTTTRSIPRTVLRRWAMRAPNCAGSAYPTVSGMLTVVAPAATALSHLGEEVGLGPGCVLGRVLDRKST